MANVAHLTSLGNLITAIQTHAQAVSADINWGVPSEELRLRIVENIQPLEEAGLPNFVPAPFESLRKFAGGQDVALPELAAAKSQLEYLSQFLRSLNGAGNGASADHRIRRLTGPVRSSIMPPSQRALLVDIDDWTTKVRCPSCYRSNPKELDSCPDCGTSLKPELRKVTVLFSDIKGFSAMSEGMNPFELVQTLGEIFRPVGFQIAEQGGRTDKAKLIGDGMMAVFGVPKSQSDDAARAVSAAIEIQAKMRALNEKRARQGKPPIELRIGINTGEVVAAYIPFANEMKYEIIGHAVNVASRLEGQADPGGVLISEATLAELGGLFEVEDRGKVQVKNISEPIMTFNVQGKAAADIAIRPRGLMEVDLLGRDNEFSELQEIFQNSLNGNPSLALVVGSAGYGKSRLGAEFIRWVRSGGKGANATIIAGKGIDLPESPPYHVMSLAIKEALMQGAGIHAKNSQEITEEKLRQHIMYLFGGDEEEASLAAELLGHFIGLPFEKASPQMEAILKSGRDLRLRREEVLFQYFERLAERQPVIFVCEDLHWMDPGSVGLLIALLERLNGKRFFTMGLTRPEFIEENPDFLSQLPCSSHRIDLSALPEAILLQMADQILNGAISDGDKHLIVSQSMGNPFVLQQMARALKEGWRIDIDTTTQTWRFLSSSGRSVPTEAQGFFQARVDQLAAEEKDLLGVASIISREFDVATLKGLGISDPEEAIAALIAKEFLVRLDRERFEFRHALLRETVERMMDEDKKKDLHLASANYYLKRQGSKELEIIAYHFERGGQEQTAASHYFEAAKKALNEGTPKTIVTFEKAYHLAGAIDFKCRVLRSWFEAAFQESNFKEQDKLHALGLELLKRNGMAAPDKAGVYYRLGRSLNRRGQLERARAELTKAREIIEAESETPETLAFKASIFFELGWNYRALGQFEKGLGLMKQSYSFAKKSRNAFHLGRGHGGTAFTAMKLGHFGKVIEHCRHGYRITRRIGDKRRAVYHLTEWGRTHMLLGDYANAEKVLTRALELLTEFKGKIREAAATVCSLGEIYRRQGKVDESIKHLEGFLQANPNNNYLLKNLNYLAFAYFDGGRIEEAENTAQEVIRIAREKPNPEYEATAQMTMARARVKRGDWEGGLKSSEEAIRILQEGIATSGNDLDPGIVSAEFDLDVLTTHAKILTHFGKYDEAEQWVNLATRRLKKRSENIEESGHLTSFSTQVTSNREVVRQLQVIRALREVFARDREDLSAEFDQINFYPYPIFPPEIRSLATLAFVNAGQIVQMDDHEIIRDGHSEPAAAVGVAIDRPLASLLAFLLTHELTLESNPGQIPEFQAEEISFKILKAQDPSRFGVADWKIGSPMAKGKIVLLLARRGTKMREILDAKISARDGSVFIDLKRSPRSQVLSRDGVIYEINGRKRPAEGEFGSLRFTFSATMDGNTVVTLAMGKALYTLYPLNFLQAFVEAVKNSLP